MTLPSVSIIIPTKNEACHIKHCLTCIAQQTYPQDKIEILIIDSFSQDNTKNIINNIKNNYPYLNIIFICENTSRTASLNKGILAAKNEVIVRIDARAQIPPTYVHQCINTLLETGANNVGGVQKPSIHQDMPSIEKAIGLSMSHPFGVGNAAFRLGKKSEYVDTVYLGCFWRKLFTIIGLFHASSQMSEDSELNHRIKHYGGTVYLNADIIVPYLPRKTLIELAKLYLNYGRARAFFLLTWKTLTGYRQCIPPLCLLLFVSLLLSSLFFKYAGYYLILSIVVYLLVNIVISYRIAKKWNDYRLITALSLTFPIMHFSWACGFWYMLLFKKIT